MQVSRSDCLASLCAQFTFGMLDIGLNGDEANELDPNRGPRIEVYPLGEKLAATVDQDQVANLDTS